MTLKSIYDDIAKQYGTADLFGSITQSHEIAIQQIQQSSLPENSSCQVLDFGVGNGAFLQKLQHLLPHAFFSGIDVSSQMLKIAQQKLPMKAIEASAVDASQYIDSRSQDLVLAHFINAYMPINQLFEQAALLTKDQGYFSFITTTYESFPKAQHYLAQFISKETLLSRIVGHYYKSVVKNTTVAANKTALFEAFKTHGFTIMAHQRIEIPITLKNINELAQFGIEGTWFLNTLSIRVLPKNFLIQRLKRIFDRIFEFPYQDSHVIDIILAKK